MKTYLESAIKEVTDEFPEVGTILDEYGVGCVTCGVGTCPVKDIISIHRLSPADEQAVMSRIAEAVAARDGSATPAGEHDAAPAQPPVAATRTDAAPASLGRGSGAARRYSPPLAQLVGEHNLIKRWLALIQAVVDGLDLESPEQRQLILDGVDFIRSYADRLHHAKEEDDQTAQVSVRSAQFIARTEGLVARNKEEAA